MKSFEEFEINNNNKLFIENTINSLDNVNDNIKNDLEIANFIITDIRNEADENTANELLQLQEFLGTAALLGAGAVGKHLWDKYGDRFKNWVAGNNSGTRDKVRNLVRELQTTIGQDPRLSRVLQSSLYKLQRALAMSEMPPKETPTDLTDRDFARHNNQNNQPNNQFKQAFSSYNAGMPTQNSQNVNDPASYLPYMYGMDKLNR